MAETRESRLEGLLKELRLSGARECYAHEADSARKESLSYERYLLEVLERESEKRRSNRVSRFLRDSKIPLEKSIDVFDRKRLPRKVDQQVAVLLEGGFIERRESSVMVTSNLPFSKWESIFKDPMTAAAAIDRLVHHSVIVELNLPSYRLETSKAAKGKRKKAEVEA